MLDANSLAFPEEESKEQELNEVIQSDLVGIIKKRFQEAADFRRDHEARMISAYNAFRGLYDKNVAFRKSEKSRVFVKATKTKVLAGYGQILEVLLGADRFPIGIHATKVPEGVDDLAHVAPEGESLNIGYTEPKEHQPNPFDVGYAGDGIELPPGATFGSKLSQSIGVASKPQEQMLAPGPHPDPQVATLRPAEMAAARMQKLILDQLEESDAESEISNAVFEAVMLGTGIIKGPFSYNKTLHIWKKNEETGRREYKEVRTKVPRLEFVSVWDAYPDPNAICKKEMTYFIHRHRMNDSQMRALMKMPFFNREELAYCLEQGPNYNKQEFEHQVTANSLENNNRNFHDRYEVLEYWGSMGVQEAREMGLDVDEDLDEYDEIQINAWICGNSVIRLVMNPFMPARIPYHIFNYERNPYSIFGIGIPENMSDSQRIMNGHVRMAIDNLALAGGLIFDVDETALVPGQDMEIYNGKIFYRNAGQPGQAVHGIKFPNTATENLAMFDKFRQIADEETGLPSYSHGQLGVTGMTRTASGMSMLMGAASLNIKTVVKNVDFQLLEPLGKDYFHWNMQFFEGDLDVRGDLEVKALGTSSLMQKEVRSQRLTMFLQTAMNPAVAPFIKIPYIVEEIAKSLELDPDKVLNSTEEARAYAEIIGLQNRNGQIFGVEVGAAGQEPGGMDGLGGVPGAGASQGPTGTGDGTIGTGIVPQPGEGEFAG